MDRDPYDGTAGLEHDVPAIEELLAARHDLSRIPRALEAVELACGGNPDQPAADVLQSSRN